jgi:uncharacterized protein YbaA (DUF1428 family)
VKTTIDIPNGELEDAMRFSGATTKREAVVTALAEYNRRRRMAAAARVLGHSDTLLSHEALMKARVKGRQP